MPPPDRPPRSESALDQATTVIEAEDGPREAAGGRKGSSPSLDTSSTRRHSGGPKAAGAQPFRPRARPPVPVLTVFDDGRTDGETIRIRTPRFVIGRVEGDLTIPLDGRMSTRHVEIALQTIGGKQRWVLSDLQSRHGLFIRVTRSALNSRSEFLVGGGRYVFQGVPGPDDTIPDGKAITPDDSDAPGSEHFSPTPSITEFLDDGEWTRTPLVKDEYWIGSDPACDIRRVGDPFCEPRHARLWRSAGGLWNVEHDRTFNGLWIRTSRVVLEAPVRFQAGEQRFQINV